jgi:hypothetical protein
VTAEQRDKSIKKFSHRGQGDNGKAIYELTKYLKVFMSDQEAWLELCDLYIMVSLLVQCCGSMTLGWIRIRI